jgi:hypothetical protein
MKPWAKMTPAEKVEDLNRRLGAIERGADGTNRVPLSQRHAALETYLRSHGPTRRSRILRDTKIPPGTLSVLLQDKAFSRAAGGLWSVRGAKGRG